MPTFALDAESRAVRRVTELLKAQDAVKPYVGDITPMAHDNAGEIYRYALHALGHDVTGLPASAAQSVWDRVPHLTGRGRAGRRVAMDQAQADEYAERFPNAGRLK